MTYGLGLLVDDGLVMMADTRTNAGTDDISRYRKLHLIADGGDRIIAAAAAGNLSITQLVLAHLRDGLPPLEHGGPRRTLGDAPTMFHVARLVGEAMAAARGELAQGLAAQGVSPGVSMLLGGRIGAGPLALYLLYEPGNFIACSPERPFLQIGDVKYGKPILDRAARHDLPLAEAVKLGLLSFDSTMRSNLAVGRPLDLLMIPVDPDRAPARRRIEADDAYFDGLQAEWAGAIDRARRALPPPPFL